MADLQFFEPALDDLKDSLPDWWSQERVDSELAKLLNGVASVLDDLNAEAETIFADQSIDTAGDWALRYEWAVLLGAAGEQLPGDAESLRSYLQARAGEDGSLPSLYDTLLALLRPNNEGDGPERDGLHFPEDGDGLHFADDGSGMTFPAQGWLEITETIASYRLDVTVRARLTFDRAAFSRAVNRFRQAHMVAPTITET